MKKLLATSIAVLLLMAGCSQNSEEEQGQAVPSVMKYEIGSNNWSSLEAFAPKDKVKEAYQFAVDHPEVLHYMPCYCGCYEDDGHTSNTDCFVDKVEGDVAVLDNMGLG